MFIDVHLLCDIYSLFSIDLFIFYYYTVGCSTLFRSQLVQYISKTKKLERALRAKDVLCSALAEKLDVMKDEKTSMSIGRTNMNNSKTNGGDCSQLKDECNGCSCSQDQTAEPSRNQTRNFQNEGTKDKSDQSVANGCVVCSSDGQVVLKTKFENMEKEMSQVTEKMNQVYSEKLQVS